MNVNRLAIPVLAFALGTSSLAIAQPYGPSPNPQYDQDHHDYDHDHDAWQNAPPEFRDVQRQGFHDGIEGARRDFDNHRRPDVNNRDEYRHPHVDPSLRHDYRQAFRQGYQTGVAHIYNGPGPR
jgi:hypothetical protein